MDRRQIPTHLIQPFRYLLTLLVALALLLVFLGYRSLVQAPWLAGVMDQLSIFTNIFLGIFIEALPFLLLGTLVSGLVEIYISSEDLSRLTPHGAVAGALSGSVLGLFIPVSECGVVPLARRLSLKGLPGAVVIPFLLAAPVINPIVIASTAAAFGASPLLYLRVGLSAGIAVVTGLVFARQGSASTFLRPGPPETLEMDDVARDVTAGPSPTNARLPAAVLMAADEFFEMGRYLVLGALMAALFQTFVPQATLLGIRQEPVISVLVLMALAVLLSVGSSVDAFLALAFVGLFSPGAILAFLVFGPVVDMKNILMVLHVFKPRRAAVILGLPALLAFLSGVLVNLLWAV